MEEYKNIQLIANTEEEITKMKSVVDHLEPLPKKYVRQIEFQGDTVTLRWNTWKPSGAETEGFKERVAKTVGAAKCVNVVEPDFRLSPSLEDALRAVAESVRRGTVPDVDYDKLETIRLLALVNAEYDFDYLGQTYQSPNESTIWLKRRLVSAQLTSSGRAYLSQGFLRSLSPSS